MCGSFATTPTLVAVAVACLFFGSARASEFSDFRIPENRWWALSSSFDGGGSASRTQSELQRSRRSELMGNLDLAGTWDLDADNRYAFVDLRGTFVGSRRHFEGSNRSFFSESRLVTTQENQTSFESGRIFAGYGRHLFGLPLSIGVRGEATFAGSQSSEDVFETFESFDTLGASLLEQERDGQSSSRGRTLRGADSVGWGHVRNATGVFDALMLERRLRRNGVLDGPLPPVVRRKLAALFYLQYGFSVVHVRPDRFFWREVERILDEAGALNEGGLSAYDAFRADETYWTVPVAQVRRVGYRLGVSLEGEEDRSNERSDGFLRRREYRGDSLVLSLTDVLESRRREVREGVNYVAEAEVHAPIGWRWQIRGRTTARTPSKDFANAFIAISDMNAAYSIADHWGAEAFAFHLRAVSERSRFSDHRSGQWQYGFGTSLRFYAEDRLTFGLTMREWEAASRPGSFRNRQFSITLGMTYRVARFDAPDHLGPVRSLSLSGGERGW